MSQVNMQTTELSTVSLVDIDTTEEMIMNEDALPPALRGWRYYRIEYGGCNEDCIWEGRIMLPPRADSHEIVRLIMGMQAYEQIWKHLGDKDGGQDMESS